MENRTTLKGKIAHVSRTYPGSIHDFPFKPSCPTKLEKNHPLGSEEKEYHQALSRIRVKVENRVGANEGLQNFVRSLSQQMQKI